MKLVIVESPTKAKTIKRFLGKGYEVVSSFGHIRDLPKGKLGVDPKNNFEPKYVIPQKARSVVKFLKSKAEKSNIIILATDEDREGEAIAWHITKALGLSKQKMIERIVFHEITKDAILDALRNPRFLDLKLVDAQKARRILDRLVGYKLSPFLWKKIARGLSAGRVQSVAVRLICEREKEIKKFKSEEYWGIEAKLQSQIRTDDEQINTDNGFLAKLTEIENEKLNKLAIKNQKQADSVKKDLEKASYKVESLEQKEILKFPFPPYITSTLQQDAAIRLRFSAKKTMFLAQRLYEGTRLGKGKGRVGLITYMRTDSVNLSEKFLTETHSFLKKNFKDIYFPKSFRIYKTKSRLAQEAHEAIRPTSIYQAPESLKDDLEPDLYKLYALIWQRALASQMNPAQLESVKVKVAASSEKKNYMLESQGQILRFDGFLKVYPVKTKENLLPKLEKDENLKLIDLDALQKFTQPPHRYSEAMLIKALEKYGIGRPSTYAPTISTIQTRGYVNLNPERRFEPSETGMLVNDLLSAHFKNIVDYDFTAKMEEDLDKIAEGKKEWLPVIQEFYEPFSKNLEEKYQKVKIKEIEKEKNHKSGKKCPLCQGNLLIKFSRYGRFLACENFPKCKHTESLDKEKGAIRTPEFVDKKCSKCQGRLVKRKGKYGFFLGCENYPKCNYVENLAKSLGIHCPKCEKGEIVTKRTKKGRLFYGCNQYPKCDFALWEKPIGKKCPKCNNLMIQTKEGEKCSRCSDALNES